MIVKRSELESLRRNLLKLKPAASPGVLTSQTTRGVVRRPTAKSAATTTASGARWA